MREVLVVTLTCPSLPKHGRAEPWAELGEGCGGGGCHCAASHGDLGTLPLWGL